MQGMEEHALFLRNITVLVKTQEKEEERARNRKAFPQLQLTLTQGKGYWVALWIQAYKPCPSSVF